MGLVRIEKQLGAYHAAGTASGPPGKHVGYTRCAALCQLNAHAADRDR